MDLAPKIIIEAKVRIHVMYNNAHLILDLGDGSLVPPVNVAWGGGGQVSEEPEINGVRSRN